MLSSFARHETVANMHYAVSAYVEECADRGAMSILPQAPVADKKATLILVIHLAAERVGTCNA